MVSKENQPLFQHYYDLLGWTVDRSPEETVLDTDYKIDLMVRDKNSFRSTVQERCGSHQNLQFLTVLVGCHMPNQFGRGELWDSAAQYHVVGYVNESGNGLSAFIPCIFPALREYIAQTINMESPKEFTDHRMVRQNRESGKRFIHIKLGTLLTDPLAKELGVLHPTFQTMSDEDLSLFFSKEAQNILTGQINYINSKVRSALID